MCLPGTGALFWGVENPAIPACLTESQAHPALGTAPTLGSPTVGLRPPSGRPQRHPPRSTLASSRLSPRSIDHYTAQFAVNSIRRWLDVMGREQYPHANRLMITADGGGSNGSRARLFKVELQKLADETGLTLRVCHFPPGTSKWNKIEHRLFCHITQTWRGKPLTSRIAVVELIAATTTTTGLRVRCELDTRSYPKGIKVTDAEMDTLNITGEAFHSEWNYYYTITPRALS